MPQDTPISPNMDDLFESIEKQLGCLIDENIRLSRINVRCMSILLKLVEASENGVFVDESILLESRELLSLHKKW